ncbi:nucleotidyltransferase domain-containing protein [Acrocarpospora sp. B8E8]|uniref:nucleotidyltransferase domain-containing protein n=1 Tax=Acrocarpospora sp. B8E8 TaxID=3153572 RepID=UPI00325ECFE1
MTDEATGHLLGRFVQAVQSVVPVVAVWAHGSLAGGDYRPGRSDLDLIAILGRACSSEDEQRLEGMHRQLSESTTLASELHCSYLVLAEVADLAGVHLRWAHEELMRKPVTPVTRRELYEFGLILYGEGPRAILPPVTDEQLLDFVVEDLETFWRPSLDHPEWWLRDIWVDLGLLTLARATVTLCTGKLITKGEALDVLDQLGAPSEVVEDIRRRRYRDALPASDQWLARRAELVLAFLGPAIEETIKRRF